MPESTGDPGAGASVSGDHHQPVAGGRVSPAGGAKEGLEGRKALVLAELDRHPFSPAAWLRNPHLQTMWGPLFRRLPSLPVRRQRLLTPDEDWLRLYELEGDVRKPVALLLHGLEGSFRSHYMGGLAWQLWQIGWSVVALEWRSCSGEINRARRLYHSGETTDLDLVIQELVRRDPRARLYLVGVSLGGNVAAKWLGERGESAPEQLVAAAVISPPFDLTVSSPAMDRALGGFYARRFRRTLIAKARQKERQYPGCLDLELVRQSRTFTDFDTHATAVLHGFRDAHDYYSSVSCGRFLARIRRPTLLIAAADDPFNPRSTLPWELGRGSPYLYAQFPARGGHAGFVYGTYPWGTRHWAEEQVQRFFAATERHLVEAEERLV